ncbi:MAG: adenine phosphoribosyltransferase [Acidimicrobiales bacterium]|jgi:adenine phosphoribosyltransferase
MTGEPTDCEWARQRLLADFPLVNGHPDVAGVLRQPDLLALLGPALAQPFRGNGVTKVMAPEARGPIFGALVAAELGAGLVLVRKEGRNHPGADIRLDSQPNWRGEPEHFQARSFDLVDNDVVLIVDDWLSTGSTVDALVAVIEQAGATLAGVAAMVDKADAATRRRLRPHTLVDFATLVGDTTVVD